MKIYLTLYSIFVFGIIKLQKQETNQIVKITNIEGKNGFIYIGWYNSSTTFLVKGKAIYRKKIKVNNQKEIRVKFVNVPSGKYAIAAFLDENSNSKLDKNMLGIPMEKYGFSNNVLPIFRAAKFEETVFELKQQEKPINIRLE